METPEQTKEKLVLYRGKLMTIGEAKDLWEAMGQDARGHWFNH